MGSLTTTAAASLALCLSGAAGLIFEIVWLDRAGLVFGNSVVAATVVLSSFMGGLAAGNALAGRLASSARRLFRCYAALEATIAVTGVALTYALPGLVPFHAPLLAAFLLMLVPAAAMGATLPIMVAAVRGQDRASFGWTLGTLYGWNTIGAVAGVLAAESTLVAAFGIGGTAWIAAALDAMAGGAAWWLGGHARRAPDPRPAAGRPGAAPSRRQAAIAAICAGLAGVAFLALEVIWFRFISTFVLTTTLVMSAVLATVLAGIAAGGLAAGHWLKRREAAALIPAVAFGAGASVAWSYAAFGPLTTGTQVASLGRVLWFAVVMTLPVSVASGVLFTLLGHAIRRAGLDDARSAATVAYANTLGAMCGPPLAAFLLLPRLGTERAFFALTAAYVGIGLIAWLGRLGPVGRPARVVTSAIALAAAVTLARFPFGLMSTTYLARVAGAYSADGSQIVATREGATESILVMQQRWMGQPIYSRLITNGFPMSGTAMMGQRYMRYFVYWPMLMHAAPIRRILVICYGAGVTAGAALDVPSAVSIDVVELSRDVAAMSPVIHAADRDPLGDARLQLHVEDGRHFLQTTDRQFDLITGEPPPPRTPGAVHIYTREYFRLIRDRLAEGGIATYWLPVARPEPGTDINTVIRAYCDVFEDCTLWNATPFDLMLVGTRHARGPVPLDTIAQAWSTAAGDRLREVGFETPEQIGATFLGDAEYLNGLTARTPPLTDDFPQRLRPVADRLSLSDPRYPGDPAVLAQYREVLDPARARDAFARSAFIRQLWPPALIEASLPWFDEQACMNRALSQGRDLRLIDDLDAVLTRTPLRTLPLWLLGSDAVKQRIAAGSDDGTGTVEYLRGLQRLVDRDYADAASYFGLAERRGLGSPASRPILAYALCRAGRPEMARQVAATIPPGDPVAPDLARWMAAHCG